MYNDKCMNDCCSIFTFLSRTDVHGCSQVGIMVTFPLPRWVAVDSVNATYTLIGPLTLLVNSHDEMNVILKVTCPKSHQSIKHAVSNNNFATVYTTQFNAFPHSISPVTGFIRPACTCSMGALHTICSVCVCVASLMHVKCIVTQTNS